MRVALFTDSYFPSVDGVVRAVSTLERELTKLGHECLIFAPTISKLEERCQDNVVYCRAIRFKLYPDYCLPIFRSEIDKAVKERDVDIIHSHALAFMALRAMRAHNDFDLPLVTTYHTRVSEALPYYNLPFPGVLRRLSFTYFRFILKRSDRVLTPSELTRRELSRLGLDPIVIPNGVDLDRFKPIKEDRLRLREIDGFKILFLGRLASEKNLVLLINSAKILENEECHFIMAGKGPAEEYLKKKVKNMGLDDKFTFLGFVDEASLPSLYSTCNLFATPSLFENMSMVMLEALACGLPVIAPQGTCFDEFLPSQCLFKPDPVSLAKRILSFKEGETEMDNPRKIAELFSTRRCAERTLEIYSECIEGATR